MNQVQMREAEIQRLRRVMQQADRKGYESQNAASLAAGELELAQLMNLGALRRAATSPAQLVGRSRLPTNASPLRPIELRSPMHPGAEGPGFDRVQDMMREELARERCPPPQQERRLEGADCNASCLRNSPIIAALNPGSR